MSDTVDDDVTDEVNVDDETMADTKRATPRWRGIAIGLLKGLGFAAAAVLIMQVAGWARAPSLPQMAPDLTLVDLSGKQVQLSELRGQPVLLNFWATWCGPCQIEAPAFSRFSSNHPDFRVIGVAADGSPAKLKKAREQFGITYEVWRGTPEALAKYEIHSFPTTVVIDANGSVVTAHTGMLFDPQLELLTMGL